MKVGVVIFPGSNCDRDLLRVCQDYLGVTTYPLWHKERTLPDRLDLIFLPGGFSYGDYLRPGAIARFSPIMDEVIHHAKRGGYVWGICNGFQILTEARLLPGALLPNRSLRFICDVVYIKAVSQKALLTRALVHDAPFAIPIAHADGNYYCSEDVLKAMQDNDQILFQYCTKEGQVEPDANPNGSVANIAGVTNERHNVWGMMPHPERAADPLLNLTDGLKMLKCLLN